MEIGENFYYLRGTKFCPTAINFSYRKCGNRIKPKLNFTASTYNSDKICDRFKQKAVEEKETEKPNFGSTKAGISNRKKKSEIWTSINESNKI